MCVCVCMLSDVQLFATPCTAGSSVHGIFQAGKNTGVGYHFLLQSSEHRHCTTGPCCFCIVKLLSYVWLIATPWTSAHQASLSFIISQSLLKLMSIESVMLSNHLSLCHPLLLLPSIFPNIRVFSSELAIRIRSLKYWSFSISIQWMFRVDFL